MGSAVRIPRRLLEKARARGVDVESFVAEALARARGIDPREEAEVHLELAERFLEEGRELLRKGDPVQASEKLYKVAEECIKAMAMALGLEEPEEARGRWSLRLLDSAARKLGERVSQRVYDDWDHAYFLHTEGLHEARLDTEQVEARIRFVEELLSIARRTVRE